jgi:hypothetical protein
MRSPEINFGLLFFWVNKLHIIFVSLTQINRGIPLKKSPWHQFKTNAVSWHYRPIFWTGNMSDSHCVPDN